MHVCKLSDVISVRDIEILAEVVDELLQEGEQTLELHVRDDPSDDTDSVSDGAEKYIQLIGMQIERLNVLKSFQSMLLSELNRG